MTPGFEAGESWWVTEEGRRYRDVVRSVSAIRLHARVEPRSKRAQQNDEFRELTHTVARTWHQIDPKYGARWPRTKAAVALDIHCLTSRRNPPRIEKFCKWLLDELGSAKGPPIVYKDDRQVKMLFARLDTITPGPVTDANSILGPPMAPMIHVVGQTAARARESIRRALEMEEPWPPRMAAPDIQEFNEVSERIELYRRHPSDSGRSQLARAVYNRDFLRQQYLLADTDELAASVVARYAHEERGGIIKDQATGGALHCLLSSPYSVELGMLPENLGGRDRFMEQAREVLRGLRTQNNGLFPLLSTVGLTVFYVESSTGKDLDNIFVELLPMILEELEPPAETMYPWVPWETLTHWDQVRRGEAPPNGASDVSFIEAFALTKIDDQRFPPGTVILVFSAGGRHASWWESAGNYVRGTIPSDW